MLFDLVKIASIAALLSFIPQSIAKTGTGQTTPHIDVFTTTAGVKNLQIGRLRQLTELPIQIHYVDAISKFERNLGGEINFGRRPTKQDVEAITLNVKQKLSSSSMREQRQKLEAGLATYQKVKALGVDKIPAIVFNDEYVVYGKDVLRATKIYYQKVAK
jgi:integrating conjugative element protein (TIGR03757 family)